MSNVPILTTRGYFALQAVLSEARAHGRSIDALERKLSHAVVVLPDDVPPDVVTLDSRVRLRMDDAFTHERILVAAGREVHGMTLPLSTRRGYRPSWNARRGSADGHEARRGL